MTHTVENANTTAHIPHSATKHQHRCSHSFFCSGNRPTFTTRLSD